MADLTEPENRNEPDYGTSRFQGSGQPGPEIIRTLDGHRTISYTPRVDTELDVEVQGNYYDCDEY